MELSLYKALSSIKIEEPLVDAVIKAMDTHIDTGISRSVIPVLAEIRSLAAKVDAYAGGLSKLDILSSKFDTYVGVKSERQIRNRWIIGTLLGAAGLTVTVVTATIGVLKAFGYL